MKHSNFTVHSFTRKILNKSLQLSVVVISIIALNFTQTNAQVDFKVGGGLGIIMPSSDLGGSAIDYYYGIIYGLKSGLNLHAMVKVGPADFNLTGELDYSKLSKTRNSN